MAAPHKSEFKPSPLGPIPVDWKVKDLGEVCKVTSGGTPDRKTKEYWGGNIPWVTTSLIDFNIITEAQEFITQEGLKNSAAKLFEPGTIIMALYGQGVTRGKVALLNINATTNQACAAIIIKDKQIDTHFLFQYLVSQYRDIRNLSNTGNQENLNGELVKSIKMPVPTCSEQQAIAHALATWDKAIEKATQLITAKEQRKKWLMQQLLTGKKRLKRFNGTWKKVRLDEVFEERNETGYFALPLLSVGASGIYPQLDSIKKDTSNEDKSKYKRICVGDIGYNTMRMWQGRSALSSLEGIVSPAYTVIKPRDNANALYFSYLFKTEKIIHLFFRNSQGLVDDTLNCKFKDLAVVKILLPPFEEQTAICQILKTADKEIYLLKQKLEAYKEQKKGLMQVLLTGKVRLKIK